MSTTRVDGDLGCHLEPPATWRLAALACHEHSRSYAHQDSDGDQYADEHGDRSTGECVSPTSRHPAHDSYLEQSPKIWTRLGSPVSTTMGMLLASRLIRTARLSYIHAVYPWSFYVAWVEAISPAKGGLPTSESVAGASSDG
jgi:hypothetical protein